MGNFINTHIADSIDMITKGVAKDFLKNPYYVFGNTKPTPCIFYQLDAKNTSVDEGFEQTYDYIGPESPNRYKKIDGVLLYGLGRIEVRYGQSDNGLEADPITGECTDLPNTIIPTPGCYFEIPYLNDGDNHYLFLVTDVTDDTMNDGANIHKISYELDQTTPDVYEQLTKQIIGDYKFVANNINTELNTIIRSDKYDLIEKLDDIDIILKQYYIELFYNSKVQTFTCHKDSNITLYDSALVEFLMRNDILTNSDEYIYVSHKLPVPHTFSIEYANTLFRCIETKDIPAMKRADLIPTYWIIKNIATIFYSRPEPYYYTKYKRKTHIVSKEPNGVCVFDEDLIDRIKYKELYPYDNPNAYKNIIIKYMNGYPAILSEDIEALENIAYEATMDLFYHLPIVIFCVEKYITSMFK